MIGREIDGSYYRADYECSYDEEVVLEVRNLSVSGIFADISFELHKGEILGIGGLSECCLLYTSSPSLRHRIYVSFQRRNREGQSGGFCPACFVV